MYRPLESFSMFLFDIIGIPSCICIFYCTSLDMVIFLFGMDSLDFSLSLYLKLSSFDMLSVAFVRALLSPLAQISGLLGSERGNI